jgi:hypothetical protein
MCRPGWGRVFGWKFIFGGNFGWKLNGANHWRSTSTTHVWDPLHHNSIHPSPSQLSSCSSTEYHPAPGELRRGRSGRHRRELCRSSARLLGRASRPQRRRRGPQGCVLFFYFADFFKKTFVSFFYKVFVLILFIIFCFVFLINFLSNFSTKIFVLNFFSKLFCFRTFDKSSFPFFDKLFVFSD